MGAQTKERTVDYLSFTSRDEFGRINWWDITPPKTDYWHAHVEYGKCLAKELILLMGEVDFKINAQELGFIFSAIAISYNKNTGFIDGVVYGFFQEIGGVVLC